MTEDHLPQSLPDRAETGEHDDDREPVAKAKRTEAPTKRAPEPAPAPTSDADDDWQRSGFGSFP